MTGKQLLASDLNIYGNLDYKKWARINQRWYYKYHPNDPWAAYTVKQSQELNLSCNWSTRPVEVMQPATDDHITEIMTSLLTT